MTYRTALQMIGCAASLATTATQAQDICSYPLGPLASKKSTALKIFSAIADGLESPSKRAKYDTEISDAGTSWSVFESLKGGHSVHLVTHPNGLRIESVRNTFVEVGSECRSTNVPLPSRMYFIKDDLIGPNPSHCLAEIFTPTIVLV